MLLAGCGGRHHAPVAGEWRRRRRRRRRRHDEGSGYGRGTGHRADADLGDRRSVCRWTTPRSRSLRSATRPARRSAWMPHMSSGIGRPRMHAGLALSPSLRGTVARRACTSDAHAGPYVPSSDSAVLAEMSAGTRYADVSARRLARGRVDVAIPLAQFYIQQSRLSGDLRYLGLRRSRARALGEANVRRSPMSWCCRRRCSKAATNSLPRSPRSIVRSPCGPKIRRPC